MEEHVFENWRTLHLYTVFRGSKVRERHKAKVVIILMEEYVDRGFKVVPEVSHVIGVKRLLLVCEVEVLNVASEGLEQLQLAGWPLLLHVLLDTVSIESVPVLIGDAYHVAHLLVHADLDRDPLVVGHKDPLGCRLIVVLASEKVETHGIACTQVQHKDAIKNNQVAISLRSGGVQRRARGLI